MCPFLFVKEKCKFKEKFIYTIYTFLSILKSFYSLNEIKYIYNLPYKTVLYGIFL